MQRPRGAREGSHGGGGGAKLVEPLLNAGEVPSGQGRT